MEKKRLDAYLTEKNYFDSREKAKANIIAGNVLVNGVKVFKPGSSISDGADITLLNTEERFASRGGFKLQKALDVFNIDANGKIAVDVGASTGGFTDCLLKAGAKKVYAIDVGYGQLAWQLRNDKRVVVMERQNARFLEKDMFSDRIDMAVMDTSFISLTLILPAVKRIIEENAILVCLIKPQFEAGRADVLKNGVVKDASVHVRVIKKIIDFADSIGLGAAGIDYSPIKGPNGNIEYLLYLKNGISGTEVDIDSIVKKAHRNL